VKKLISGVALATALSSAPALADGGYYAGALGARAAGRGGAFVARADDPTAISINPAGLASLRGTHLEIGNQFSYNSYAYTRATTLDYGNVQNGMAPPYSFARVTNGAPAQAADPFIGVTTDFGLSDWGFGLAAFAPPGIAQEEFPQAGGQNYMMIKRQAIILDYAASAAWKYHDLFGLGVTAEWLSLPRLQYDLMINGDPFPNETYPVHSPYDLLAQTTGSDWFAFNARLGAWVRPTPWLELAASGQVIPTNFVTHSTLSVNAIDDTLNPIVLTRDKIAANGATTRVAANDVTIKLPLPMMARAGARYIGLDAGVERWDLELDVEYETWSRVNQFTVDTTGLTAVVAASRAPITSIVVPKQWKNTVSVKLGGDVALVPDRWKVRAGAYYESAVASPAYANVDFPGGPQIGGALGGSFLNGGLEVALTYQFRYQTTVTVSEADARVYQQVPVSPCKAPYTDASNCTNPVSGQASPPPVVNAGTYSAMSHLVSLAVLYRFGKGPGPHTQPESQP
jgi:long-chain fatty acid transport protein